MHSRKVLIVRYSLPGSMRILSTTFVRPQFLLLSIVAITAVTAGISAYTQNQRPLTAESLAAVDLSTTIRSTFPSRLEKGGSVTFRITVKNTDIGDAIRPRIVTAIPSSLEPYSAKTSPECSVNNNTITCTGPSVLEFNDTWDTALSLSVPPSFKEGECPANFTVWTTALTDSPDANESDNTAGATVTAHCPPIREDTSSSSAGTDCPADMQCAQNAQIFCGDGQTVVQCPDTGCWADIDVMGLCNGGQTSSRGVCGNLCNPGERVIGLVCNDGYSQAEIACPASGCVDDIDRSTVDDWCSRFGGSSRSNRYVDLQLSEKSIISTNETLVSLFLKNEGNISAERPHLRVRAPSYVHFPAIENSGWQRCALLERNSELVTYQCERSSALQTDEVLAMRFRVVLSKENTPCEMQTSIEFESGFMSTSGVYEANPADNVVSVPVMKDCSGQSSVPNRASQASSRMPFHPTGSSMGQQHSSANEVFSAKSVSSNTVDIDCSQAKNEINRCLGNSMNQDCSERIQCEAGLYRTYSDCRNGCFECTENGGCYPDPICERKCTHDWSIALVQCPTCRPTRECDDAIKMFAEQCVRVDTETCESRPMTRECYLYCLQNDDPACEYGVTGGDGDGGGTSGTTGGGGNVSSRAGNTSFADNSNCPADYKECTVGSQYQCPAAGTATCSSGCIAQSCTP